MAFIDTVRSRQSTREFDARPVSREDIAKCIEAARLAPSACNSQPWEFIVVDEPQALSRLATIMTGGAYGMNAFLCKAPVIVVIASDGGRWAPKACNLIRDTKLSLIDIGIAGEHFLLQAAELGIGTCWIGWFDERAVKKLLGITGKRVHVALAMGYERSGSAAREKARKEAGAMSRFWSGEKS